MPTSNNLINCTGFESIDPDTLEFGPEHPDTIRTQARKDLRELAKAIQEAAIECARDDDDADSVLKYCQALEILQGIYNQSE